MSTLSPAVPKEELERRLTALHISPRFIRSLLRDQEFNQLLYKNHQLCYLAQYATKFDDIKLSFNQLAVIFSMNARTVSRSLAKGPQDPKPKGRHSSLDPNIENSIVEEIINRSNSNNSMTPLNILTFVQEKYGLSLSRGWLNQFFLRHNDCIKKVRSFPQENTRMSVPRVQLKDHIINMHKYVDGRYSELVFNLDEVGTSEWEDRKPKRVFIDKLISSNSVTHSITRNITHMTLLTCVSDAGDSLTPFLLMKYQIHESLWKT